MQRVGLPEAENPNREANRPTKLKVRRENTTEKDSQYEEREGEILRIVFNLHSKRRRTPDFGLSGNKAGKGREKGLFVTINLYTQKLKKF